ncbi:MAG: hypothetical protein QF586_01570 [Arenicellales bacterium]|nr:hypothetical protein [Arenicellales bacterium]MDP7283275.1 hypothetical protein [Arenicellales bacterium]MDP7481311.1 hypothetical protein [Arenicellales bacterium]HJL66341.1 hypothetical protein [Arenicellales bacterium]
MKRTGGFVDLRIQPNSRSSLSDDSVWPSFTDIMTVVVMIFLMALVVIMIRNTELGQQLQQKSEEISVIDTQKQETQSHRETLAVRLNQVQRQLNELNKRLSATRRERDETQATLVVNLQQARELKAQIEALKVLRSKLVGENEALTRDKEGLGTELAKVKQESRESRDREERRISELMRQVLSLEAIRERLIAKAESLTTQKETLDLKLTEIQQLNEKRVSEKEREIGELTRQILSLQVIREELVNRTEALSKEKNELGGALARAQKSEDRVQASLTETLQQARELKAQVEALKALRSKLVGENEALTRDKEGLGTELARVKQESRESGDEKEEQISELTRQVLSLEAVRERLLAETDRLVQGREALGEELAAVTAQSNKEKARQEERLSVLTEQLQALLKIRKTLAEQNQEMERKSAIAAEKLAAVEWALQEKVVALAKAEETIVTTTTERKTMEGEFSDLKTKYNKLIRPARSEIGRHVVALLYRKRGGQEQYKLKLPQERDFRVVTMPQLHSELASLKQQYGAKLYTKIIIPDDSGLSFSQAWKFQLDIFNKYDYYYQ